MDTKTKQIVLEIPDGCNLDCEDCDKEDCVTGPVVIKDYPGPEVTLKNATAAEFVAEWKTRCPCQRCTGEHCEECVWCADPCTDNFQEAKP